MLKNRCQTIKTTLEHDSRVGPKKEFILGEMPLGAPLVAQAAFVIKNWAPSVPKVLPMIEKCIKNDTKELPDCDKEL